ncbi:MAG: hypothetical protein H6607_12330 [Flavobacteriales bacterium]|nr:hypothetical protein [Flavobacteriales bacterium]
MKKTTYIAIAILFISSGVKNLTKNKGNTYFALSSIYFDSARYDSCCYAFQKAIGNQAYNAYNPYSVYKYVYAAAMSNEKQLLTEALQHAKCVGIGAEDIEANNLLQTNKDSILKYYHQTQTPKSYFFQVDSALLLELQEMKKFDQTRRSVKPTYPIDSANLVHLKKIIAEKGFPNQKTVGYKGMFNVYLILQHCYVGIPNEQGWIIETVKKQIDAGWYDPHEYAVFIDRALAYKEGEIIYGTLLHRNDSVYTSYPTKNLQNVDYLRKELGIVPLSNYLSTNKAIAPVGYKPIDFRILFKKEIRKL